MKKYLSVLAFSIAVISAGCGGGGNGDNNNVQEQPPKDGQTNPPVTPVQPKPPTENTEQISLLKQVRLADAASELQAKDFNLSTWNPRAIAIHKDVLYIANSSTNSRILRYDLKTKRVLSEINPEVITGLKQPWNTLNDVSIFQDRLYVASYPSNRVDIFDIATGEPQFVMSLGTGAWSGDQTNYAIVHTHAVAANQQFIFAPDINGRINVWRQSDAIAANHLKAPKYARLVLSDCGRYCDVRLETVGDFLYASTGNGHSYVFDLRQMQQGSSNLMPIKKESGLANVYTYAQDGLLYAARPSGVIESYNAQASQNNARILAELKDRVQNYRLANSNQSLSLPKSLDLAVYQQTILSLSNGKITLLPLRTLRQNQSSQQGTALNLKQAQAVTRTRLLQDGESWETLTNVAERHVYMDKILSASLKGDSILFQSYSAIPVTNLEIHAKLKNTDQWMLLGKLDQLEAFSRATINIDVKDTSRFSLVDGKGSIQLQGIDQFSQLPADLFDFKITSKTDKHVQKLNSIQPKWQIFFGTYNQDSDSKWRRINPLYAREWVMIMTNFAYVLSTPEFEHAWFNHQKVMGHEFFNNNGLVNGAFKPEDYERTYQQIMNRSRINLGITNMGGGLGGGEVLGIDTWIFYGHYRLSGLGIVAHEFGHHWGNHNSAWSNASYGFQPMIDNLFFYFQRQPGVLPYTDPNVNKFHLAPADQLYAGIANNIVNGKPGTAGINKIDRYFAANPLK